MNESSQDDLFLMNRLRAILLKDDREALHQLRDTLENPELLSRKVAPIVEEHIDFLKKNFPVEFRNAVSNIVDKRIQASQNELMDALYPVMGQMIKKYIAHQFQQLKDGIDQRIKESLNTKNIWWRIRVSLLGLKDSDIVLKNLDRPKIEEVCLIQRNSGLLMGSASLYPTVDKEVIAGMLTAIKAFVEDAFQRDNEELEMIQYGSYKILLYNFHTYYVSVALSGSISNREKEIINDQLHVFAIKELKEYKPQNLDETNKYISEKLDYYFIAPQREDIPSLAETEKQQAIAAYD
jgi:hypothetical protein